MKRAGIYKIEHIETGRVYVGSAKNIHNRFKTHRSSLNCGRHYNRHLQGSWRLHGAAAFAFAVLEFVDDLSLLIQREQHWIDSLMAAKHPNFNLQPIANSCLGMTQTQESNRKRSNTQRGVPKSAEVRAKIAAALKGKKKPAEQIAKMVASRRAAGYSHTTAAKAKMSASHRASIKTAAHLARVAELMRTPEMRAKYAVLIRGRDMTPKRNRSA